MFHHKFTLKKSWFLGFLLLFFFSSAFASEVILKISAEAYEKASLKIRNNIEILREIDGNILIKCESSVQDMLDNETLGFETIAGFDYHREDLPLRDKGGIPMGLVIDRGHQGIAGWHNGVAIAGDVLGYMELYVDGQLPGFTFWDMKKDSVWHHYIDTELDSDEPLFMEASESKIYYTFHFTNPAISNSDMRYYWYDVNTGEHGEVENFGYGFEGFGVSDKWMMRVGNKGMGWNNQIYAHNIETGVRFEILADSVAATWGGYNYDNFGGPRTNGNTLIYTYIDYETYTPDLLVRSLGADGIFGTADDITGTLSNTGSGYGQYRVDGRYIVWIERNSLDDGNVRAYDMGEDELYGTDDDGGIIDVCLNAFVQSTVRVENNIIIWMDNRNSAGTGEYDIYGYDLENDTEYQLTRSADSLTLTDIHGKNAIMVKTDPIESGGRNDIYIMNFTGRIKGEYYHIDIRSVDYPTATSYLTGDVDLAPGYLNKVVAAGRSHIGAIFVVDLPSGNDKIVAYSAVTGEWASELLSFPADDYTVIMEGDNGLILGKTNTTYEAWTYNGATGAFSSKKSNIVKPTGFAVGKNMAFVWTDEDREHYLHTYDGDLDTWTTQSATTNDPWHVIHTDFSDSLGILLHGQGDTICNNVNLEAYDLELHDWVTLSYNISHLRELNRRSYKNEVKIAVNDHFVVAAQEYNVFADYIYTYSLGDDDWKVKMTAPSYDLDKPLLGDNFIVQGCRSGDRWQGHIYNGCSGEWLPEYIESGSGIDGLNLFPDMMIAWRNNIPYSANVWAYSSASEGIQQLNIPYPGDDFTVETGAKAAFVYEYGDTYVKDKLHVFNGIKGEWKEPLLVTPSNKFDMSISGHTGIFLEWIGKINGSDNFKAHGYSVFKDEWDILEFRAYLVDGIHSSDFCGLISYDHYYYHSTKYIHAFNSIEGEWSRDVINMYNSMWTGLSMNDRIMMIIEDNPSDFVYAKVHVFSPILNMWNSMSFDTQNNYSIEGYYTTPTSAFAWNNKEFRIIFSTQNIWDKKFGQLDELHVTDYAIAATLYNASQYTTYHFYPPKTEIINEFEISDGPNVDVKSSWAAEIVWKTNMNADTRLVWGVDGYYDIIEKDTASEDYTKDHRVLIEGLEANKTYYYGAISVIAGVDTTHSDTLNFTVGADNTPPSLIGPPEAYRIHDHEASVWWETNEPSTPIIQWGLTSDYTDTLEFNDTEPYVTNSVRMYGLTKNTTYHYRVGGYDRYGNGPFFSGDYTFSTENELPRPTNLQQADSTLYGAAYMTWEPPRYDSTMSKETFSNGIPVDWKIYNRGDNKKGTTWTSGYMGDNAVAYCNYGKPDEHQEEWLISGPITIDHETGGVLNFWHTGFYTEYDNAHNKVMVSWTGTDREDFRTVWSSRSLPEYWSLVQVNLDYAAHYGQTMYLAFVYESTDGEVWAIDNIYIDYDIDGFSENFNYDKSGWENVGGKWGLKGDYGSYVLGVEGIKNSSSLPDPPLQTWDAWEVSPFFKVTESHHILGFWQSGWGGEYDTKPNEVRVVYGTSSIEVNSELVRTVYPVPNGWMWTTVSLSPYIGETIRIGFRYQSNVGWYWNGEEWLAYGGEDWYIDDVYLFENAPAMVEDPDAKPNEKPLKFASSHDGKRIDPSGFSLINSAEPAAVMLASGAPEGTLDLPKERPAVAIVLPSITAEKAPSVLAEPKPQLMGYAVYGRYPGETEFFYLGYVRTPSFVDWDTYLGYDCEYYVEAYYDKGYSQPCETAWISGGIPYKDNEYGYDTGTLYYSYWWYPGNGFANEFAFGDSVLDIEKIKVHIKNPGSFKISLTYFDHDVYYTETTGTINATQEGWYTIDPPGSDIPASNHIFVEVQPQDTLVSLNYENFDCGYSWLVRGNDMSLSDKTFYIRLIGEKSPYVAVADIPETFNLAQNYPNPFNPTTTIAFDIPEASDVDIRIYDIRGVLVKTLASGHRDAGRYHMIWNATNTNGVDVASGVYLIRMTAGDFVETRKMVLVR